MEFPSIDVTNGLRCRFDFAAMGTLAILGILHQAAEKWVQVKSFLDGFLYSQNSNRNALNHKTAMSTLQGLAKEGRILQAGATGLSRFGRCTGLAVTRGVFPLQRSWL